MLGNYTSIIVSLKKNEKIFNVSTWTHLRNVVPQMDGVRPEKIADTIPVYCIWVVTEQLQVYCLWINTSLPFLRTWKDEVKYSLTYAPHEESENKFTNCCVVTWTPIGRFTKVWEVWKFLLSDWMTCIYSNQSDHSLLSCVTLDFFRLK